MISVELIESRWQQWLAGCTAGGDVPPGGESKMLNNNLIAVLGVVAASLPGPVDAGEQLTVAPAVYRTDSQAAKASVVTVSQYRYGGYRRFGPYGYGSYFNYSYKGYNGHYSLGAPRYNGYAYSYRPYYYRPARFYYQPSSYYGPGYSYAAASTYYRPYYSSGYYGYGLGTSGYRTYNYSNYANFYSPAYVSYGYPSIVAPAPYYVGPTMAYVQPAAPGIALGVSIGSPAYFGWSYPSYRYYSYGTFGTPFPLGYGYYGW